MRKFLLVLLSLVMIFSLCLVAFATDSGLPHAPDLNDPDRLEEVNHTKAEIEAALELSANARVAYPIIRNGSVSVPTRKQETKYYCGPASVQMVLESFDVTATQSVLASAMGTTSSYGTYVYMIRNCLNNYLGNSKYQYYLTSEIAFSSGLERSIDADSPVVCHVMTGSLPAYAGANYGHYVVATGYYRISYSPNGMNGETVYYNDPHYNDIYYGARTCTYTQMTSAINANAGYYIMGG